MHERFVELFKGVETTGKSLIELGCGASIWLPYFAKEFGFKVSGLDYSEAGCEKERRILANSGIEGEITCGDFFDPPKELLGKFDFAYSSGVAEHFVPTERCLSAFAAFLKPGGTIITLVPNLTGVIGTILKSINRPVYDIHVLLDTEGLRTAHEKAGFEVVECRYFLSSGFGMAKAGGVDANTLRDKANKAMLRVLEGVSAVTWAIENKSFRLPESRLFSPYVYCVAKKPDVRDDTE